MLSYVVLTSVTFNGCTIFPVNHSSALGLGGMGGTHMAPGCRAGAGPRGGEVSGQPGADSSEPSLLTISPSHQ